MAEKPKRIKNPNPPPEAPEPVTKRIKAGPPGSPVALPGDPEVPQEDDAAKKTASAKKK
jgi:hypothetical protein